MELILHRHGKPQTSEEEMILGSGFVAWLGRYRTSDVESVVWEKEKYSRVYSSTLRRSISTAQQLGNEIIEKEELCEAELPELNFPNLNLKAKVWLVIARLLWVCGLSKGCESHEAFKRRVESIVTWLDCFDEEDQVVIIAHGWFNRTLTKALLKRNWTLKESTGNNFLSYRLLMNPKL